MLGQAAKISVTKEACIIVGDGSTQTAVEARVKQVRTSNTTLGHGKQFVVLFPD